MFSNTRIYIFLFFIHAIGFPIHFLSFRDLKNSLFLFPFLLSLVEQESVRKPQHYDYHGYRTLWEAHSQGHSKLWWHLILTNFEQKYVSKVCSKVHVLAHPFMPHFVSEQFVPPHSVTLLAHQFFSNTSLKKYSFLFQWKDLSACNNSAIFIITVHKHFSQRFFLQKC